ncbi:hypothetical protein [Pseudoalteromonas sp. R3]|uniref:hypothetical protein n=1 Tax=Pseudoalteromonas sp. R3 TaxID=1709477 RepID=UPI0006B6556B|nr:hypothetical protein [Pseudoalteromonas sp. R3]AZZ98783.1 hypothetical protein ELR70_17755 [Pseudoalteromonas sp. R3]
MSALLPLLNNTQFIQWFKSKGGGYDPVNHPLLTKDEMIRRWTMTDAEYMAEPHLYWPSEGECKGKPRMMPPEEVAKKLKARQVGLEKLWRYAISFWLGRPPYSVHVTRYASEIEPWTATEQEIAKAFHAGTEFLINRTKED